LKSDTVTFLYQQLPKYDETKGHLAFSYFNIIAKNFLTIKSKKRTTSIKRSVSLDDPDSMGYSESESLREHTTVASPDDQMINKEFIGELLKLFEEIHSRLKNENEIKVMDCIIYIFNHIDMIDLLNKRAVFFYIREMTGLSAKQLTTCMASIKKHFKELRISDDFGIF
jgi:hypothetical protein